MLQNNRNSLGLTFLTVLFFSWGFITCLNDILIPHLKELFTLSYTEIMLVQFTFFGAYFVMSYPAGKLVTSIGNKKGIISGLLAAAFGALFFIFASWHVSYVLFLLGLAILASGITILQVAANPLVAIMGTLETASSRLNMTQAFNSLGTTIAPIVGSFLILQNDDVKIPYLSISIILLLIAFVFSFVSLPEIKETKEIKSSNTLSAFSYPHLILGAIAIFVYVGAEVSIGSFLINYCELPEIGNLTQAEAGHYVSLYWGGAMIGRFFAALALNKNNKLGKIAKFYTLIVIASSILAYYVTKDITSTFIFLAFVALNILAFVIGRNSPAKTLSIFALIATTLILITSFSSGMMAVWTIVAIGLFNSIMFPTIFTLAIDGLSEATNEGSGILCMAIVGGALIPLLTGVLADSIGIQKSFLLTTLCYMYIAFYGIRGHKHK